MKYYVVAKRWNSKKARQVRFVAGEFNNLTNALIFANAYNDEYNTKVEIHTDEE